jgi:hypothetical protein
MASEENNAAMAPQSDSAQNDSNKQEVTEPLMAGTGGEQPPAAKPTVHKQNYEKDVIYLYQFSRTPLLPSLSPYCLKVETWLRLAGLKYEVSPLALNVIELLQVAANGGQNKDPQSPQPKWHALRDIRLL